MNQKVETAAADQTLKKLQLLRAMAESGRPKIAEFLALLDSLNADVLALRKSKRELESLKKTLEANPALEEALTFAQFRELLSGTPRSKRRRGHLSDEEKQKSVKDSKRKYERFHRETHHRKRTSLIKEQFGNDSFPSLPSLLHGSSRYTCLDEVLRGDEIKMADLEGLFAMERHRFKGCLVPTGKRGLYDYRTVLKIAEKVLRGKRAWLSNSEIPRFLHGLAQRANEIAAQEAKVRNVNITPQESQRLKAMGIYLPVGNRRTSAPAVNKTVQGFVKSHLARLNSGK